MVSSLGGWYERKELRGAQRTPHDAVRRGIPDFGIVSPLATQLSWTHVVEVLPLKTAEARLFYLGEAAKVPIQRPVKIRGDANPYDPAWELYFDERFTRHMQSTLDGRGTIGYLWKDQSGRCPVCSQPLTEASGWHLHHRQWRVHGGDDGVENLRLLHANCHRQIHSAKLEGDQAASCERRS